MDNFKNLFERLKGAGKGGGGGGGGGGEEAARRAIQVICVQSADDLPA
jgi:hypothetical protein